MVLGYFSTFITFRIKSSYSYSKRQAYNISYPTFWISGNNVLRGHSPPPLAHRLPSTHSPHPPLQDKHRLRPGSRGGDSGSGGSSPAFRAGGSSPAFRGGTSSPAFRGVGGGQGQLLPGAGGQGQLLPGMTASFLPPPMLHQVKMKLLVKLFTIWHFFVCAKLGFMEIVNSYPLASQ